MRTGHRHQYLRTEIEINSENDIVYTAQELKRIKHGEKNEPNERERRPSLVNLS
jgi:hypothetical protein